MMSRINVLCFFTIMCLFVEVNWGSPTKSVKENSPQLKQLNLSDKKARSFKANKMKNKNWDELDEHDNYLDNHRDYGDVYDPEEDIKQNSRLQKSERPRRNTRSFKANKMKNTNWDELDEYGDDYLDNNNNYGDLYDPEEDIKQSSRLQKSERPRRNTKSFKAGEKKNIDWDELDEDDDDYFNSDEYEDEEDVYSPEEDIKQNSRLLKSKNSKPWKDEVVTPKPRRRQSPPIKQINSQQKEAESPNQLKVKVDTPKTIKRQPSKKKLMVNSQPEEGITKGKKNIDQPESPKLLKEEVGTPRKLKRQNSKKGHTHDNVATNTRFDINKMELLPIANKACSLKLNVDLVKKNEPLILTKDRNNDFHLALPDLIAKDKKKFNLGIDAIQFDTNKNIYLACPGNSITENPDYNELSEIACVKDSQVSIQTGQSEKYVSSKELYCESPPTAATVITENKNSCGAKDYEGKLVEIGFKIEGWHKLIDACFDDKESKTLYVTHKLYGKTLPGAVVDSNRPSFKQGNDQLYLGYNPNKYYQQASQLVVLTHMLGKVDESVFSPAGNLYLARGHYAPDSDFLMKTWQDLTYFFINVGPQWQSINQGHWLSVENLGRERAMQLAETFDVATGPYGIMKVMNKNGVEEELYLRPKFLIELEMKANEKTSESGKLRRSNSAKYLSNMPIISQLPVSEYYWKVLHRPVSNQCIVLISSNNPFISSPVEFCKNICAKNNWPVLRDPKKGFLFCCEYKDFKKVVVYAPSYDCSGGILLGPK